MGTQGLKVRNLGQAGRATVCWRGPELQGIEHELRQGDRENASPAELGGVSELCVWFHFRHHADL